MNQIYENIITLPHHVSERRGQMPLGQRAAQFAPFAALSGYEDAVTETARLTETRAELDEDEKRQINDRISMALHSSGSRPRVRLTYFEPDIRKSGGRYAVITGVIERFDDYSRLLILSDGRNVNIDDVVSVNGRMFE